MLNHTSTRFSHEAPVGGEGGGVEDAGSVSVLPGGRAAGDQRWSQGSRGVEGAVGTDGFGRAL